MKRYMKNIEFSEINDMLVMSYDRDGYDDVLEEITCSYKEEIAGIKDVKNYFSFDYGDGEAAIYIDIQYKIHVINEEWYDNEIFVLSEFLKTLGDCMFISRPDDMYAESLLVAAYRKKQNDGSVTYFTRNISRSSHGLTLGYPVETDTKPIKVDDDAILCNNGIWIFGDRYDALFTHDAMCGLSDVFFDSEEKLPSSIHKEGYFGRYSTNEQKLDALERLVDKAKRVDNGEYSDFLKELEKDSKYFDK